MLAVAVDEAVDSGSLYFSSAGNDGNGYRFTSVRVYMHRFVVKYTRGAYEPRWFRNTLQASFSSAFGVDHCVGQSKSPVFPVADRKCPFVYKTMARLPGNHASVAAYFLPEPRQPSMRRP